MRCQNVKAMSKIYKPCLSFFISFSFSRLSRSLHHLSLFSLTSSTPQHSQSVHATYEMLNSLSIVFYCSHSLYTWCTKPWQPKMASQLYFIVLTVHTCDVRNHDRLKSLSIVFYHSHSLYMRRTKPWQTTTSVGLAQARPNYCLYSHNSVVLATIVRLSKNKLIFLYLKTRRCK